MKNLFFLLFVSLSRFLYAQNSPIEDAYTTKGAQALSVKGYFGGGTGYLIFFANLQSSASYEYFLLRGLSISGTVYNTSSLTSTQPQKPIKTSTRFDAGLQARYYFALTKKLPYRPLFVEVGLKTQESPVNNGIVVNRLAFVAGIGAQIKIRNNWFAELYAGYNTYKVSYFAATPPIRYGSFVPRIGLTYRIPSKRK